MMGFPKKVKSWTVRSFKKYMSYRLGKKVELFTGKIYHTEDGIMIFCDEEGNTWDINGKFYMKNFKIKKE